MDGAGTGEVLDAVRETAGGRDREVLRVTLFFVLKFSLQNPLTGLDAPPQWRTLQHRKALLDRSVRLREGPSPSPGVLSHPVPPSAPSYVKLL